ncbi:helix-turn-helix domain-containing protein [Kitasatospora mediocidica]|uniref:helix-turn-helix domain-containing protein n=1 Tax=Kitasatospora mediocidica TaxID=58352 RepID=UPI00055A18C5|nr:helix-turn-helix domain-containing protein [Kitasatospora mediocidica]
MSIATITPIRAVLYTPEEAAKVLRISRSKLYQLLADHELTSIKIGRCRRVRPADIDAYIERQAIAAAA